MPAVQKLAFGLALIAAAAFGYSRIEAQQSKQEQPAPVRDASDSVQKAGELRRFRAHEDWVWSVALSPDGKTLVSSGGLKDHLARSWDFATGKRIQQVEVRGKHEASSSFPMADARPRRAPTRRLRSGIFRPGKNFAGFVAIPARFLQSP